MRNETAHIIQMMKATRQQTGIIARWKADLEQWAAARNPNDPDIAAVRAFLPLWQARPFYTVEELAPMWPALAIATGYTLHWPAVLKSPKLLEHELDFYGLPHFESDGRKYYIVESVHYWKNATQEERQNALNG